MNGAILCLALSKDRDTAPSFALLGAPSLLKSVFPHFLSLPTLLLYPPQDDPTIA